MNFPKIASNSTNSAGISSDGKIYVWGSTRFGLICGRNNRGDREYETTPQELMMIQETATKGIDFGRVPDESKEENNSPSSSEEERSSQEIISNDSDNSNDTSRDLLNKENKGINEYSATTISMGLYHAVALLSEKDIPPEFTPILANRGISCVCDGNCLCKNRCECYVKCRCLRKLPCNCRKCKDCQALSKGEGCECIRNHVHNKAYYRFREYDGLSCCCKSDGQCPVTTDGLSQADYQGKHEEDHGDYESYRNILILGKILEDIIKGIKSDPDYNGGRLTKIKVDDFIKSKIEKMFKNRNSPIINDQIPAYTNSKIFLRIIQDCDIQIDEKDIMKHNHYEEEEDHPGFAINSDNVDYAKALLIERLISKINGTINLKEFRDQILGIRSVKPIVISWGMYAGGRLGFEDESPEFPKSKQEKEKEEDNEELIKIETRRPTALDFGSDVSRSMIIIKVACGNNHTLALSNQGELYSWGINNKGCLGFPQDHDIKTPKKITTDSTGVKFNSIIDIACGGNHNLALSQENRTFSWGNGDNGRLGHDTKRSEAIPKEIISLKKVQPKYVFCGEAHSACISNNNIVYTWGKGSYGRLGHGFTDDVYSPKEIEELINKYTKDVYLGSYHSFFITKENKIYTCGGCNFGKLGIRGKTSGNLLLPTCVPKFCSSLLEIAPGPYHTLALETSGKLYTWGNGRDGVLGHKENISVELPQRMKTSIKFGIQMNIFKMLSNKMLNSNLLKANPQNHGKEVVSTGDFLFDKLDDLQKVKPKFEVEKTLQCVQVGICEKQTIFLANSGELYGCGATENGILDALEGKDEEEEGERFTLGFLPDEIKFDSKRFLQARDVADPTRFTTFRIKCKEKVQHISCGAKHVCAVTTEKEVYTWGDNSRGQCGLGVRPSDEAYVSKPERVKLFEGVKMGSCGDYHTLLCAEQGIVYFFGYNIAGNEADKTDIQVSPESLEIRNAIYVAAGPYHNAAICLNTDITSEITHEVLMWGRGWNYQLGNGKKDTIITPYTIKFKSKINPKMITCGARHTLVLDTNGSIWFWGNRQSVGIQDEKNGNQKMPQLLLSESEGPFTYISTNHSQNLALTNTGYMISFGGDNPNHIFKETEDGKEELEVAASGCHWELIKPNSNNVLSVVYIHCGYFHNIAITEKGYPYAWGNNINNRCGINPENIDHHLEAANSHDSEDDEDEVEAKNESEGVYIENPVCIQSLRKQFKANMKRYKLEMERFNQMHQNSEEEKKGDSSDDEKNINLSWAEIMAQKLNLLTNDYLKNRDNSLRLKCNELVTLLNESLKLVHGKYYKQFFNTGSSIISNIYNSQNNTENETTFCSNVPRAIMLNKHIYEEILSLLQLHPCLIKMIIDFKNKKDLRANDWNKADLNNEESIFSIVNSIFMLNCNLTGGPRKENIRCIYLILSIMRLIVLTKQNKYSNDLHEVISSKNLFHQLFLMVFNSQEKNKKFVEETMKNMAEGFIEFIEIVESKSKQQDDSTLHHKANNGKEDKPGDTEEEKFLDENDNEMERDFTDILDKIIPKMLQNLEDTYKTMSNSNGNFLTNEIRWLISFIKKNLILEIFQRICPDGNIKITENEYEYFKKSDNTNKILLKFIFDPLIKKLK